MPTTFAVDHEQNAIFTTATGILSFEEIVQHLQAKEESHVLDYAELFDARDVSLDFSVAELRRIADEVRRMMGTVVPGKVAVVTNNNFIYGLARTYQAITTSHNSRLEVFKDFEAAREWLLEGQRDQASVEAT